jgi:serine/threonine-protein kinase 11
MVVGSPAYQAPEALNDSYSSDDEEDSSDSSTECPQKEDVWSLGVTLYQLLFSQFPFEGENLYEIVASIKRDGLSFPEDCDPEIESLLRKMLTVDPAERIGVEELLQHPLIATASDLVESLPEVPVTNLLDGETVEIEANVCGDDLSFARMSLPSKRRFSFPPNAGDLFSESLVGTKSMLAPNHSDGEDEEPFRFYRI